MNANTVTASNGPTMKYHCTVALAEKTKQNKKNNNNNKTKNKITNKTKRHLVTTGQVNMKDPKQNKFVFF